MPYHGHPQPLGVASQGLRMLWLPLLLRSSQANLPPSMKASIASITCTVWLLLLLPSPRRPVVSSTLPLLAPVVGILGLASSKVEAPPHVEARRLQTEAEGVEGSEGAEGPRGVGMATALATAIAHSLTTPHPSAAREGTEAPTVSADSARGDRKRGCGVVLGRDLDLWRDGDLCCCRRLSNS